MFKKDLLKGKRILVTGGGTGLGKEMATHYGQHGADLYICGSCLLYTSPSPRDKRQSRMPSSA